MEASPTLESQIKTKCSHIFNYESGRMVEKNPKHSDYLKSIEFIRKQFSKALLILKKKSKNSEKVQWPVLFDRIEEAENGNDFISIIKSLPLEGGRIVE
jgi:hypothetical protein